MATINIVAVRREGQTTSKGDFYWGIKINENDWLNLVQRDKPQRGTMEVEINGKWARPVAGSPSAKSGPAAATKNGQAKWTDYLRAFDQAFIKVAGGKEEMTAPEATVICSMLIAIADGKVAPPVNEEEPDEAPPPDDDIPF